MKLHQLSRTILFLLLVSPLTVSATQVTRDVFVASVEQHSALLVWHTQELTTSIVEYGTSLSYGLTWRSKELAQIHEVPLFRLEPGQRYYYRVRTDSEILFEGSEYYFETAPS
jgi:hypothetical protein